MDEPNQKCIRRFSTPLEDYCEAVRRIKTLADVRDIEEKYSLILDDAAECFARINDENFHEFLSELKLCFADSKVLPSEGWLEQFGAIPLPELFIHLAPFLQTQMGSGFVMSRLLDEKMAEIKDGRFRLLMEKENA